MPPVCTEHQHQLFYNKKSLLELDVPPRKLLHRRGKASSQSSPGLTIYVPSEREKADDGEPPEEEGDAEEGEVDAYSCDEFRMFEFKVRRCVRGRSHDWTDCHFVHPGEKARRRDPRRYHYSGAPCPDYRRTDRACPRGDACDLAHGVFEAWLHPARYRTMPCKDGRRCRRKVCFFAHTPSQLRVLPIQNAHSSSSASPPPSPVAHKPSCCAYRLGTKEEAAAASATSPSSILMIPDLSPPFSPQVSPPISPSGLWSRKDNYPTAKSSGARFPTGVTSYEAAYAKLFCSFEAVQLSAVDGTLSGLDGGVDASSLSKKVCKDFHAGLPGLHGVVGASSSKKVGKDLSADQSGPDLGWVEELLI